MRSFWPVAWRIGKRSVDAALGLALLFYPLVLYFGLKGLSPQRMALLLLGLLIARLLIRANSGNGTRLGLLLLPPLVLCGASAIANTRQFMLYLPVFVAIAMLLSFAVTLLRGPSAAEIFARLQRGDLTLEETAYCRRVTQVWVAFFAINGLVSFCTIQFGTLKTWALYNGLVAYFAMAGLFAAEFIYRHWRFRTYIGLPTDPFLRRIFPPRA